ncbi:MAG: hypothetical protein WAO21_08620 [Verrucomicrobiia bacterium]
MFGVLFILFGIFWPLVDDLNGGQGERMVSFWCFEAAIALAGIFLLVVGYIRCYKAANKKQ